jgi:hypothetical protein
MQKLIFGSVAAKHWFKDFREPHDIDYLTQESLMSEKVQHYWYGESSQWIIDNNKDSEYVDPEILYAIKAAHCNWDIFWNKTASDIIFFQKKGLALSELLYKLLLKDFRAVHGKRWAKLKGKDADTFFQDAIKRKYVHDSIHEI